MTLSPDSFKWIPIFGKLIDCDTSDFYEAFKEVFTGLVVSTSPVWLYIILSSISSNTPSIGCIIYGIFSTGILAIYAATLLAPIIYTVFSDKEKPFPCGMSIMITSLVIWLISAGVYVLSDPRMGNKVDFEPGTMPVFSSTLFSIALVLLFVTTVYKNQRMGPAKLMFNNTHSFVEAFNQENEDA